MSVSRLSRRLALLGMIVVSAFAFGPFPAAAEAHAILITSIPPAGGRVKPGATMLEFHFNSRIDHERSRLTLVWPDHRETVLEIEPGTEDEVLASHADLIPGAFTMRWLVLTVDGHITRGDVAFTVPAARVTGGS